MRPQGLGGGRGSRPGRVWKHHRFQGEQFQSKPNPAEQVTVTLNLQHAPSPSWHPEEPLINPTTLPGQRQGRSWATPGPQPPFLDEQSADDKPNLLVALGLHEAVTHEGGVALPANPAYHQPLCMAPSTGQGACLCRDHLLLGTRPRGLLPVRVCVSGPKYTFWRLRLCEGHLSLGAWVSSGPWRPPLLC